jgi:hypothetical protein
MVDFFEGKGQLAAGKRIYRDNTRGYFNVSTYLVVLSLLL